MRRLKRRLIVYQVFAETKVGNNNLVALVQQYILRLDIAERYGGGGRFKKHGCPGDTQASKLTLAYAMLVPTGGQCQAYASGRGHRGTAWKGPGGQGS